MKIGCGCIVAEVRLGASRWQQRRHIMTCRILYSVLPSTQPPGEYTANVKRAYASSSSSLSLRISLLATNNKLCATVHRYLQGTTIHDRLLRLHLRHRSSAAACAATLPFDVRSSGLFCVRPGGLELVTRLPSRSDAFC